MTTIITSLTIVVIIFAIYILINKITSQDISKKIGEIILLFIILDTFLLCWFFSVDEYYITENSLIIKRKIKPVEILFEKIKNIERIKSDDLKNSIRIFGNGGFFGFYGLFSNKKIGRYTAYFSNLDNLVLIETENKKIVI